MSKQLTCEERVGASLESTMEDLEKLWEAWKNDDEYLEDLGNLYEYGLAFDYVAPETFRDQPIGFFRYQLSCGGPQEEFRIFTDPDFRVYKIEYWFLDWFDGAKKILDGEDFRLMDEIFQVFFVDSGTAQAVYSEAKE